MTDLFPGIGDAAAPGGGAPPQRGMNPLGFFGNLVGDFRDTVTGLGSLVGVGIGDLVHAGTLGAVGDSFRLDDVAKALPHALAQDYGSRYGSVSKFGRGLYEHPGSFLLDLLTVGDIAAKGAQVAGLATKAGTEFKALGRAGALAEDASRLGADVSKGGAAGAKLAEALKVARGAGYTGDIRSVDLARAAAGERVAASAPDWVKKVLPGIGTENPGGVRYVRGGLGDELVAKPLAENPVKRLLTKPLQRIGTEPVSELATRVGDLALEAERNPQHPGWQLIADRQQQLLDRAQSLGLSRVESERMANFRLRTGAAKLFGEARQDAYTLRNQRNAQIIEATEPIAAAGLSDQAAGAFQRLDVDIPGLRSVADEVTASRPGLKASGPTLTVGAQPAEAGGGVALATRTIDTPSASVIDQSMEQVRQVIDEQWTKPLIDSGQMTAEQALDRSYLPLRMKYGAKFDSKAIDPLTGERSGAWVGGPSTTELHDLLTAQGIAPPIYFPHFDPHRVKFSDFLMQNRISGLSKDPAFLKLNRGKLLERGDYLKNPQEVYLRRSSLATMHDEVWGMAKKTVDEFGLPVTREQARVLPPGWGVVNLRGLKDWLRGQTAIGDGMIDGQARGLSADEALAQALHATEGVSDDVAASVGGKGGELYAVPKAVLDSLRAQVKPALSPEMERFLKRWWDTPMNVWRGLTLAGSPRWLVNNLLGNILFAKMQGAKVSDALRILTARFKDALNHRYGIHLDTSLLDALDTVPGAGQARGGFFSAGSQYQEKLGSAANSKVGRLIEAGQQSKAIAPFHSFGAYMRGLNSEIEDAFRQASYLKALQRSQIRTGLKRSASSFWSLKTRLDHMAEHGTSEAGIRSALDEVNYFLNDYAKKGPIERKVMARFLVPFWSFYKHVIKLTVSFPGDFPARAEVLKHLADTSAEIVAAQTGAVPEWLKGAVPITTGADGTTQFLNTGGPNPFDAILGGGIPVLSQLSPPAKTALEQVLGRSLLTNQEFTDPNVVQPFGSDLKFRISTDAQGNPVGAEPTGSVRPGILEALLRNIPQYQTAEHLLAGGKTYDTTNAVDILRGRGVVQDAVTGEARVPYDPVQQLLKLLGFSTTDYNLPQYQGRLTREQLAALKSFARRSEGVAPAQSAGLFPGLA